MVNPAIYNVPPIDEYVRPLHEVLAYFLAEVGFTVHGQDNAEVALQVGMNIFVDFLPSWFQEQDVAYQYNPGDTWILIRNEPMISPSVAQSKNQKIDSRAVIETHHSNRDMAAFDVQRLFNFLSRRENVVQFVKMNEVAVHLISTDGEPSFAGEDDAGRVVYSFTCMIRGRIDKGPVTT